MNEDRKNELEFGEDEDDAYSAMCPVWANKSSISVSSETWINKNAVVKTNDSKE